jgi:hypothetical protein
MCRLLSSPYPNLAISSNLGGKNANPAITPHSTSTLLMFQMRHRAIINNTYPFKTMVATRSKGTTKTGEETNTGSKRAAPSRSKGGSNKKVKKEVPKDGKLEIDQSGDVGLKKESGDEAENREDGKPPAEEDGGTTDAKAAEGVKKEDQKEDEGDQKDEPVVKSHGGETKQQVRLASVLPCPSHQQPETCCIGRRRGPQGQTIFT